MQRLSFFIMVCAALLVVSGCASKKYVRNQVQTSSDTLTARIETNEGQIKEVQDEADKKVAGVDSKVSALDAKTSEQFGGVKTDVQNVDQKTSQANSTAERAAAGAVPLVLRADQDQPGRGRQRALLLGPRDQGRPGAAPGDAAGRLPPLPAAQQGTRAVLRQVRRTADRPDAPLPPLRQEQPHGQPVLHPLWQSPAIVRCQLSVASMSRSVAAEELIFSCCSGLSPNNGRRTRRGVSDETW